jgi:hypothetical protein
MITAGESAIEGGAGFGTEGVGGSCWAAEVLQSAHKLTMIVAALMFLATVVASSVASALNRPSMDDGAHLDGIAYGSGRRRERTVRLKV